MRKIYKSAKFIEQYEKFDSKLQLKVKSTIGFLQKNEFPLNLRVHMLTGELSGIFSCSVDYSHRIMFRVIKNNDIELILVGDHSIYRQGI